MVVMLLNRLRMLRNEKALTQKKLAKKLNIEGSAISKYEQGIVPLPYATVIKLTEIFNVTSDFLLGLSDERTPYTKEDMEKGMIDQIEKQVGKDGVSLMQSFLILNENGRKKAVENIKDMTEITKYRL